MSMFKPPASLFNPSPSIPPMFVADPETAPIPYTHATHLAESNNDKEHLMRLVLVLLRGLSSLFSFLCFLIILTVKDFSKADTYNYVLAVSLLSIVYNVFQTAKGINELASLTDLTSNDRVWAFIDFIGDQVIAYMVLSGSSAGLAATNEGRQLSQDMRLGSQLEYDKAAAANSMLFFSFIALVFPTLLSFHKLSQTLTSNC